MVVDRLGRSGASARRTPARAGRILVTVTAWTSDELTRLEPIDELGLASRRSDGSLRRFVTIWFVRLDDDLYVRSAYGYDNPWFQRALASGDGRIRVGGMERDVTFVAPGPEVADDLNAGLPRRSTTVTGRASSGRSCRRRRCGRRSRWCRADVVR